MEKKVKSNLDTLNEQKLISYSYEEDTFKLTYLKDDTYDTRGNIGVAWFYFSNDKYYYIIVLDTDKDGITMPIEKSFTYDINNVPQEKNIKTIINNNPYSVIFKMWIDKYDEFHSVLLHNPDF